MAMEARLRYKEANPDAAAAMMGLQGYLHGSGLDQQIGARRHFDESEYVALVMAINVINCWNRPNIATANAAGRYHPASSMSHG